MLALPGYRGVLSLTLAEAMWLAKDVDGDGVTDVVVAHPSVHRYPRSHGEVIRGPLAASLTSTG